MVGYKLKESI